MRATLGERMKGKTCAGSLMKGLDKDGNPKAVYIYNVVDNAWSMKEYGDQAVVWQTAIRPSYCHGVNSQRHLATTRR
jgi:saccharopine dehydrogenase-like NADP-dependent oxidoreductase